MTFQFSGSEHINAPIVALHSSASNGGQWKQLAHDLGERFTVHAFDLPGYGRNPLTGDRSQTGTAISAMPVVKEIERMGSPVHLVGHSNGGGVAFKIALMRPDLVKSLTIYEPATFHFLKNGDRICRALYGQIRQVSKVLTAAYERDDASAGMKHFLNFWNGEGFWETLPPHAKQRFAGMISSVLSDFRNGFAETWEPQDLSMLEMPALVMTGLDSPELTQRVSVEIARALPNARIALLPELGHMAPVCQPEWINSRVLEHVACVERPVANCSWPTRKAA